MPNNAVLVTGAAGFIGFHVAQRLLAAGREVVGLDIVNDYYDPKLKEARLEILKRQSEFQLCEARSRRSRGDQSRCSRSIDFPS